MTDRVHRMTRIVVDPKTCLTRGAKLPFRCLDVKLSVYLCQKAGIPLEILLLPNISGPQNDRLLSLFSKGYTAFFYLKGIFISGPWISLTFLKRLGFHKLVSCSQPKRAAGGGGDHHDHHNHHHGHYHN